MILSYLPQSETMRLSLLSNVIKAHHRYRAPTWGQNSIYKFTKQKYMDAFFDTGSIKIGTLHGYQDTEKYGNSVGDSAEGKSRVYQYVKQAKSVKAGSFLSQFINLQGGTIKDCQFFENRTSPDAFLFCAAAACNQELFQRWNAEEGYDACYEISNMAGFVIAISKHIKSPVFETFESYPSYVDGDIYFHSALRHAHPATIKQKEFEWQREYRAVWVPKHPLVYASELYLHVPEARQHCRKFATWDSGKVHYL